MGVRDRRVLVLGGSGLLGEAIAHCVGERGGRPLLVGRNENRLRSAAARVEKVTDRAVDWFSADIVAEGAPAALACAVRERVGAVDDLVWAVGPFPRTPLGTLDCEALVAAFVVHAAAPCLVVQALERDLRASKGAVVALGDVGVEQPFPNHVAYLAAKGAVRGVVSALAADLAPDVRVNGVAVGVVTDTASAPSDARTSRLAARSRLGRMGTPEEVARVVVAQLEATWVTGAFWTVGT